MIKEKLSQYIFGFENETKQERIWSVILTIIFIALVVWIIYLNMTQTLQHLNSDIVNEITYKQQVYETRSLLPDNWVHPHELHTSRLVFLFIPIYALTGDILYSQEIAVVLGLVLQLVALTYLLRKLKLRRMATLLTLCLYLGFNAQCGLLFTYFDAYAGFAVAIFLTLGLKIDVEEKCGKWSCINNKVVITKILLLFIIAIYMGYGTPKLAIMLYVPLLATDLVLYVKAHGIKKYKSFDIKIFPICLSFGLLLANGGAYITLLQIGANFYPMSNTILPLSQQFTWTNISIQFESLFQSIGLRVSPHLATKEGVFFILSILILVWSLFGINYIIKSAERCAHRKVGIFLIFSTILIFIYLFVTGTPWVSYRYFLPTTLILIVSIGITINFSIKRASLVTNLVIVGIVILIILTRWLTPFDGPSMSQKDMNDIKHTAEYIKDKGYTIVTAQYWNAGLIKAYSNWELQARQFNGLAVTPFIWITDKSIYEKQYDDIPNIVILTDDEEKQALGDVYFSDIFKDKEKIKEIGKYNLYLFNESLFKTIKLPQTIDETTEYDFDSWPAYTKGQVIKNKTSLTIGPETGCFFGPYWEVGEGEFDIILKFKVHKASGITVGSFSITKDCGAIQLANSLIEEDDKEVILKDIKFKDAKNVEFVGIVNDQCVIEFYKIIITRKQ